MSRHLMSRVNTRLGGSAGSAGHGLGMPWWWLGYTLNDARGESLVVILGRVFNPEVLVNFKGGVRIGSRLRGKTWAVE